MNANQLSPRISLTYGPFDGTTFHAGYARYFTPPVQVIAAPSNPSLFTACPAAIAAAFPACTTVQAPGIPPPYYPMLPERANVYDVGVVQKVWPDWVGRHFLSLERDALERRHDLRQRPASRLPEYRPQFLL